MRALEPPGWLWLLRHEARLEWRAAGGASGWILLAALVVVYPAAHLAAWAMMRHSPPATWLHTAAPALILLEITAATLALSSAFGLSVRTLFYRGDLDLLLSAPVSPTTIFAVRALFVAAGCVGLLALIVSPVVNVGVVLGHGGMLLAYPVIGGLGLACAAIAFWATLALGRLLGVRRARVAAQVLGAFIGAAIVIVFQLPNLLPRGRRVAFYQAFAGAGHGWFGESSPLAWPLRAALGDPLAALLVIGACVLVFLAMLPLNRRAFIDAVQRSADAAAPRESRQGRGARGDRPFASGLARIVIAKEVRLLARDPMLVGSTLLQMLYLVPLVIVAWSQRVAPQLVGPALILLLTNLCGSLAWICVSAEEAPDLLGSAPVEWWRVHVYKALAASLAPALLGLPVVAWYGLHSARDGAIAALCLAVALASSATIQLWHAKRARARELSVRRKEHIGTNLLEMVTAFGWAGACLGLLIHSLIAIVGVAVAAGALGVAYATRTRTND